ncbi:MAG: rhodanese-like domain-containing protein [Actinomycetota bacterium]|nr:rhodanese-like domain-containing protein [Actinomycetota bacterium]
MSEVPQIDADEAAQKISVGAFLLDVREPDEWEAGHAPAATHIPLGQVQARVGEVPADMAVVVVCRMGGRSQKAAEFLRVSGIDASNLSGGMRAWATAGHDVVTDGGDPGTVI